MTFLASAPSLKRIRVGIERTWYCAAVTWFSSTLSLTMRRSSRSCAISSSTGPTTRHGPHHGAQKSTSTGVSDSRTSAWKLLSVTSGSAPAMSLLRDGSEGYYTKCSAPVGPERYGTLSAQPEDHVRRDVDLDEGRGDQHRDGDADRDERRGEQLVPVATVA